MASEITYAEVRFKADSSPEGPHAAPPRAPKTKATPQPSNPGISKPLFFSLVTFLLLLAISFFILFIIFFQKYSQLLEGDTAKELPYTELNCTRSPSSMGGKAWSCCPQKWHLFRSHCYLVSDGSNTWEESKKLCSEMQAHLVVINSKEEQDFITRHLDARSAYFLGLWDPTRQSAWEWVDGTPYNLSATFWRAGEPSSPEEACVVINLPRHAVRWAWNDIRCSDPQGCICEMPAVRLRPRQ